VNWKKLEVHNKYYPLIITQQGNNFNNNMISAIFTCVKDKFRLGISFKETGIYCHNLLQENFNQYSWTVFIGEKGISNMFMINIYNTFIELMLDYANKEIFIFVLANEKIGGQTKLVLYKTIDENPREKLMKFEKESKINDTYPAIFYVAHKDHKLSFDLVRKYFVDEFSEEWAFARMNDAALVTYYNDGHSFHIYLEDGIYYGFQIQNYKKKLTEQTKTPSRVEL